MGRARLAIGFVAVTIGIVGCGGTNTRTVVTIENHTTTATTTKTVTTSVPSSVGSQETKCGHTSYCPVVVSCPAASYRASTFQCRGVAGVFGDHIVEPKPGPDNTGLRLTCSWSAPAIDRTTATVLYVCDPDPPEPPPAGFPSIRTLGDFVSQPLTVREQIAIRVLTTTTDTCFGGKPTPYQVAANVAPEIARFHPGHDAATGLNVTASMPIRSALTFAKIEIGC